MSKDYFECLIMYFCNWTFVSDETLFLLIFELKLRLFSHTNRWATRVFKHV